MKIGIVMVVYSGFPHILFDSLKDNTAHDIRWYVHCHSADPALEAELAAFCTDNPVNLTLHRWNRGLARSWNDGILESYAERCDHTLVVNDDIAFLPGGLDQFIAFLNGYDKFGIGWLHGREAPTSPLAGQVMRQDFACFAFGPRAFREIGAFDENFFPAYSEDTDYIVRVRTAGVPIIIDDRILVEHARNHTSQSSPELRQAMLDIKHANKTYFATKWGAPEDQDQEAYTLPWEGRSSLRIEWDRRHNPFGEGRDRSELQVLEPERRKLRTVMLPDSRVVPERLPKPDLTPSTDVRVADVTIRALFKALLGRESDDAARDLYGGMLRAGSHSVDDICLILRTSDEYKARMAAATA